MPINPDPLDDDRLPDEDAEGEGDSTKDFIAGVAERCQALARQWEAEQSVAVEVLESEKEESRRVGFSARLLVQATLPHSEPKKDPKTGLVPTEFVRSNGFVTMKILSDSRYGLPFGTYPRLLLSWITTEAVRTKSSELELGGSLSQFMEKIGLGRTGGAQGTINRLRSHMQRLFTSTVSATYYTKGDWRDFGFRPIEGSTLFWDPQRPNQSTLWDSRLKLNQTFFEEITHSPVPIDLDALKSLSKTRSPMAIDIYQWLTHRMSYLRQRTSIPWEALALQFGGDYTRTRDFKRYFLLQLKKVMEVYPTVNLDISEAGIALLPSPPHIRLLKR